MERFAIELVSHSLGGPTSDDAIADLHELRMRAVRAMAEPGPLARSRLRSAGLDEAACRLAISLEERRLRDPQLVPGMPDAERQRAQECVVTNERTHAYIEVWQAMCDLVAGDREHDGRLFIRRAASGLHDIVVTGIRAIHPTLRNKPILHLDATLRTELARSVLRHLDVREIEAAAPHMSVRLVTGSFGKGQLCPEPHLDPIEAQRRRNRLAEVVDYARWQARRAGRVLVVTYKDCEDTFAGTGVEVAHFNAIAGLDAYRDVDTLIVVGRPLPSDEALAPLTGAFFLHLPTGGYERLVRGVRMCDGNSRTVRVRAHTDPRAEVLRAAICDDELIQAIGRGRGINRTADAPLEVHVLADVALPLVHDAVVPWEAVAPDIVQRMLLAGIAVDSPADAVVLHPALLGSASQAEKAFQRAGFGGQNPIRDIYREMSAKSAVYRRPGRGRSRQTAWWISGDSKAALGALTAALGPIDLWEPAGD